MPNLNPISHILNVCKDGYGEYVLETVRLHYADFGPTFALEKPADERGISVSNEVLRTWMADAGIWMPRKERRSRVYQPQDRHDCFGEQIQIDGSRHWWFEDRGPKIALLVQANDATSKLVHLRFAEPEYAFDFFNTTKDYPGEHGKPLAFFSNKHASRKDATTDMTQFSRA